MRDEHIASLVDDALVPRFREEPIAPLLGGLLDEAVRDDLHHGLVDLALRSCTAGWCENPETVQRGARRARAVVGAARGSTRRSPPGSTLEMVRWVADIRDDPHHHARQALDSMLAPARPGPARSTPTPRPAPSGSRTGCSTTRSDLVAGISLWNALRRALLGVARGPAGRRAAAADAARSRRSPTGWPPTRSCAPGWTGWPPTLAVFAVERYGAELTTVITHTIERWDGKEAARRIELHVGRDLQFIRINGTIVGGLVGVLIHTVAVRHSLRMLGYE